MSLNSTSFFSDRALRKRKTISFHGFTLFEVLLVLSILAVLAALTLPLLGSTLADQRLRKSADTLRAEWARLRILAMEEGKIHCFRCMIAGSEILTDRVLDVHFTATLTMEQSLDSYQGDLPPTALEEGGFRGEDEDFILRDPSQASEDTGAVVITLPEKVFVADALALPDERAAYYIGQAATSRDAGDDENSFENQAVADQDARYGETTGSAGTTWSAPIFFFPDGTCSTAAVLLKNERGRCIEVRLRGLTSSATLCEIVPADRYTGEMNANTEPLTRNE